MTGVSLHGLLATYLAWLQAGRLKSPREVWIKQTSGLGVKRLLVYTKQ